MTNELTELKNEILQIKERNKRVELDKAWETSLTRKIMIIILTYIVITIFFYFAESPNPMINAIVPSLAFFLSTLTIPIIKKIWIKNKK